MSTSNATTESCAYAEKPSQAKTPKQAAQGAPSDKGGRPADAALLTPPLNSTACHSPTDSRGETEDQQPPVQQAQRCQSMPTRRRREGLPVEVLGDILRWLPRSYLDRIQTMNHFLNGVIIGASQPRDTETAPRRRAALDVVTLQDGSFEMLLRLYPDPTRPDSMPTAVVCSSTESFIAAIANCYISFLTVGVFELPTDLLDILIQESHRWRSDGIIEDHPQHFATQVDFHRFFDELAVTQGKLTFDITHNLPFAIETPCFWNLEAVRHCEWLVVDHIPPQMEPPFSATTALQWLATPPPSLNWKRLHFFVGMLAEPLEQFCASIRTDFMNASAPNTFRIRIRLRIRLNWVCKKPVDNNAGERLYEHTEERGEYLVFMRGNKSELQS